MTSVEINKIIAEFMGYRVEHTGIHIGANYVSEKYSESIDALVPVWEKLNVSTCKVERTDMNQFQERKWKIRIYTGNVKERAIYESAQYAASLATARVILELNKGKS